MSRSPLPRHSVVQPLNESYRLIALTQRKTAIVDAADFEWLSKHTWCTRHVHRNWYAVSWIDGRMVKMHNLILPVPKGFEVDHRNRDGLDNRRHNLRQSTHLQNTWNSTKPQTNTSGFKGVYFNKKRNLWAAQIVVNSKPVYLGSFPSKEQAAKVYDTKARELRGEFASPNFGNIPH